MKVATRNQVACLCRVLSAHIGRAATGPAPRRVMLFSNPAAQSRCVALLW